MKRCTVKRLSGGVVVALVVCLLPDAAQAQWTWTPQTGRFVNVKRLPKETPELQIEYARSFLIAGDYKKALHETEKFREFYGEAELADQNQFVRGEILLAQGQLLQAAKEFQQVVTRFPNSPLFEDVIKKQYEIGDRLYQEGEAKMAHRWRLGKHRPFKRAITVYSMVIEHQPFSDAAAEAQYKVGLCHYTRKEFVEAAFEYRRVVEDYSTSDWVDEAAHGLALCYYEGSHAADYDQEPSRLAVEAMDDFKTRFPGDSRIAELDTKRAEMRERMAQQQLQTARFYEQRRDFRAARLYYEAVTNQFGETAAATKASAWLAGNPATEASAGDRVLEGATKAL